MLKTQQITVSHNPSFNVQAKLLDPLSSKVQAGTPSSRRREHPSAKHALQKTRRSPKYISIKAPFQMLTGQVVSNFTESAGPSGNNRIRRSYQYENIGSQSVKQNGEFKSNAPMMLLPKATVRTNTRLSDLYNELRDGSVIPMDLRDTLKLSTLTASTPVFHKIHGRGNIKWSRPFVNTKAKQRQNESAFDTMVHSHKGSGDNSGEKVTPNSIIPSFGHMSRPGSSVPFFLSPDDKGSKSVHLESYADETRVTFRGPRRKTIGDLPVTDLPQNRDRPKSADIPVVTHLKGIASFLGWMLSRYGDRKELQHLPRNNYVLRGRDPYFTNFVYKVPLHSKRADEDSSGDEGGRYTPEDGNETHISYRRRRSLPAFLKLENGCSGAEGRPTSPTSCQTDVTEDEPDFSVEFTNLIDVRITRVNKKVGRIGYKGPTLDGPSSPKAEAWKPVSNSPSVDSIPKKTDSVVKPARRRRCVLKKEKKPIDRPKHVRIKDDAEAEITKQEEDKNEISTVETPASEPPPLPKVEAVVPDLPKPRLADKESKALKRQNRSRRSLIFNTNEPYIQPELLEKMETESRLKKATDIHTTPDSDDSLRFVARPMQLAQGRLALSQQSSRFELPMDMKILETLSPQDYVRKFCVVSSRRRLLYQKIFFKNKDKSGNIPLKDLERGLRDVLVGTLTKTNVKELCEWLEIDEETKIDFNLFSGTAALAERVLYPQFVTGDTLDLPEFQREKIECADFGALSWKLNGVNVNPSVKNLLKLIT